MSSPTICLFTPVISSDAAHHAPVLKTVRALLSALPITSVVLQTGKTDETHLKKILPDFIAAIQDAGAAALLTMPEDLRIVARLGLDGVHSPVYDKAAWEAQGDVQPDYIFGCGGLKLRDTAMQAGEAGVDYVIFGEPRADGSIPDAEWVLDRVSWWAELFTVSMVAYAANLPQVGVLAATGADFIALGPWVFDELSAEGASPSLISAISEGLKQAPKRKKK